jgi:hypothetical protein
MCQPCIKVCLGWALLGCSKRDKAHQAFHDALALSKDFSDRVNEVRQHYAPRPLLLLLTLPLPSKVRNILFGCRFCHIFCPPPLAFGTFQVTT